MTKRVAKGPLQSFHRNQQESKVRCTLARLLFSAQEHPSLLGAQATTGYTSPEGWQEESAETEVWAWSGYLRTQWYLWSVSERRRRCTGLNRSLTLPPLQRSGWVIAHSSTSSAPSSKDGQHHFQGVFLGLERGQEGEGWQSLASLGTRRRFLSLLAGITLWGDVNFLP